MPPVSAGDIYANYSAWEKVKWGLNIGGEKALNAVVGFSDTITFGQSQRLTKKWASYLAGFHVSKTVEEDHAEMQKSWFYTGGEVAGVGWDIALGGKTIIAKAGKAGWSIRASLYQRAGGGGINLIRNGVRRFAIDYHKYKLYKGGPYVNWVRKLHIHFGKTKSQMKKHRAVIDYLKWW